MRQHVYTMFISNNCTPSHLLWKENFARHRQASKYCETDCRSTLSNFRNSEVAWKYENFQQKVLINACERVHFLSKAVGFRHATLVEVISFTNIFKDIVTCHKIRNKNFRNFLSKLCWSITKISTSFGSVLLTVKKHVFVYNMMKDMHKLYDLYLFCYHVLYHTNKCSWNASLTTKFKCFLLPLKSNEPTCLHIMFWSTFCKYQMQYTSS